MVIWAVTVIAGLLLRRFAFDDGTAPAFVIVTAVVLGVLLVGWRLDAARLLVTPGRDHSPSSA